MNKTPISVMVLSIVGLVWAALGFLGFLFVLIIMFGHILPASTMTGLYKDPIYMAVTLGSSAIGTIAMAVLTACAIGSLKLKPWARTGMLVYAYFAIAQAVVGMVFNFAYVIPKMTPPAAGPGAAPGAAGEMIGGVIGGMCGGLGGMIFPVCILIFYNRQNVKDAFNGIFPVSPTNFPVEYPGGPSQFQ